MVMLPPPLAKNVCHYTVTQTTFHAQSCMCLWSKAEPLLHIYTIDLKKNKYKKFSHCLHILKSLLLNHVRIPPKRHDLCPYAERSMLFILSYIFCSSIIRQMALLTITIFTMENHCCLPPVDVFHYCDTLYRIQMKMTRGSNEQIHNSNWCFYLF